MNLQPIKRICHFAQKPFIQAKNQLVVLQGRVMSGPDPHLDAYRIFDRIMSTAAILTTGAYAVILTKLRGEINGAHIMEVSRISRSFGVTRRSGRHYTLTLGPSGTLHIRKALEPGISYQSIALNDENRPYENFLARIAAFEDKSRALSYAQSQSPVPVTDHCGIGNARHISCFW